MSVVAGGERTGEGPAVNATSPAAPTDAPQPPEAPKPGEQTGSLATPTDAYKTAFAIRQRKDGMALKRVLSKEILEFFTLMGKADGKSLEDMLKELAEKPQAKTAETRNEKIAGNRAVLEYKDENGEWKPMDFEKEGDEWKLTLPKAEPGDVETGPARKP